MPVNPLQPFLSSWQKRLTQAQKAGVDPEAFRPVFSMDLQRLQSGSAPLTDQQAAVAIGGAAGAEPIKQTGSNKPDWNPMHLLGGIGKDVGSTLKMIPRIPGAIAKDVSHIGEMPGALAKGAGEIATGHVGEGLQDIAKAPGLQSLLLAADFIPGVDEVTLPITAGVLAGGEAGKALTPTGRKEISQHPGNTLLNLLPGAKELDLIGGVSKVANLSDAEKARVLTGNMTEEQLATKTMVRVPGKVRAALQQTPAYQQAAEKMAGKGFGTDMRALFVAHNEAIKELGHSMDSFATQHGVMDWAALDEGTRASITHELGFARRGGDSLASSLSKAGVPASEIPRLSASLAPMVDYIAQRGAELMSKGDYMHVPIPAEFGGGFEIYHPSDAVAKRYSTLDAASQTHVNALERVQAARDRLEAAGAAPDLQRITSEVQKLAQRDLASNGAGGAIVQAEQDLAAGRLGKASQGLRKAGVNLYADQLDSLRNGKSFKARDELTKAQQAAEKAKGTYRKAQSDFHRSLAKHPSPRYMPAVEDAYWKKMTQIAQGLHTDDPALHEAAIQAAGDKFAKATFEDGTPVFPQANKVLNQTAKEWLNMRQSGLDPVFLHKMAGEFQAGALPKIDPGAILKPSTLKARSLDVSGGYYDLGFGLVRSQAEFESERLARQVVEDHIIPHLTKPKDEVVANLLERARNSGDTSATQASVESQLMQDHIAFNAQPFGTRRIKGTTDRIISTDIQRQIDRLAGESPNQNFLMRGLRKGTGVYIFAVTGLSPLHQAHVLMSNLFASMSTDPVRAVTSVTDGWNLMKGRGEFAGEVPYTLRNPAQLPEELANLNGAGGKTAIRLAVESKMPVAEKGLNAAEQAKHYALWFPKKLQEYQVRMDEYMSTMARSVNYVMQRKEGWDPEQALREVGRVYALHTDLSPFERNVMRSFAPFYSWTRYLMRFALQYPFDHPVRAGIVSNFAQTEVEDWGKGLPQDYAQLFFLGHPDPNTGKQSAFDIRQINPFRDVGRDFTWAGVVGSLHPAIGAALTSMGMNTYTGSAELYPELTVDPTTGQLKAKGTSFLGNLAQEAVPQTKAIQGLLGWSDQMRQLQKTDPAAFRASIARSFHFPWLPKDISIPQARAKEQLNQLRVAQQDISNALRTGKFGPANQFNKVPFQGQLVPPQMLEALYQLLQSKNTGFTPNTLLRK